jgi:hypothetical protein
LDEPKIEDPRPKTYIVETVTSARTTHYSSFQVNTTLPELPVRISSNPFLKSA